MPKTRRPRRLMDFAAVVGAPEYSSSKAPGGADEKSSPEGLPCLRTVANAFLRKAESTSPGVHVARSRGAIAGTSEKHPALTAMFIGVIKFCSIMTMRANMSAERPSMMPLSDATQTASAKKNEEA